MINLLGSHVLGNPNGFLALNGRGQRFVQRYLFGHLRPKLSPLKFAKISQLLKMLTAKATSASAARVSFIALQSVPAIAASKLSHSYQPVATLVEY